MAGAGQSGQRGRGGKPARRRQAGHAGVQRRGQGRERGQGRDRGQGREWGQGDDAGARSRGQAPASGSRRRRDAVDGQRGGSAGQYRDRAGREGSGRRHGLREREETGRTGSWSRPSHHGEEASSPRQQRRQGARSPQRPARRFRSDAARRAALEALTKVHRDDAYANLVLPEIIAAARLDRRDAAFATALTYGTLRLQGRYDEILRRCVDRPLDRVDLVVLDVLRLGAHQLLGMRVATHAAVSATVDLATDAASRGAAGLVNAVLRKVAARDLEQWLALILGAEEASAGGSGSAGATASVSTAGAAAAWAHPEWVVRALRQALVAHGRDPGELVELLEADNADPLVTLCARPGLVSPEHLIKEARAVCGEDVELGRMSPYAVVLGSGDPGAIASVRRARAGVEDEGSQLVALLASEAPVEGRDERWLDMCAGPGGKAALLGARAAQRGAHLLANEVSPHRTGLVRSSVAALSTGREGTVEVRCADGRLYGVDRPGYFDRVLVDAPCSGLGSLRRRPESRWRRQPSDVADLTSIQRDLLLSAVRAVRVGGVVAYVTCSPHVAETTMVLKDVRRLAGREGIEVEPVHAGDLATRVAPVPPAGSDGEVLQLWPHRDGTDAMFCGLWRRLA